MFSVSVYVYAFDWILSLSALLRGFAFLFFLFGGGGWGGGGVQVCCLYRGYFSRTLVTIQKSEHSMIRSYFHKFVCSQCNNNMIVMQLSDYCLGVFGWHMKLNDDCIANGRGKSDLGGGGGGERM